MVTTGAGAGGADFAIGIDDAGVDGAGVDDAGVDGAGVDGAAVDGAGEGAAATVAVPMQSGSSSGVR